MLLIVIYSILISNINTNEGILDKDIKIISYNIHSGVDKDKFPTLFDTIDFLKNQ